MKDEYPKAGHGGNIWRAAARWGLRADQILDFSANINPLGPSSRALQTVREQLDMIRHYPEPGGESLLAALALYLGMEADHVVLGNGGSELIYLLGRMFYRGRVLVLAPGFSEYGAGLVDPCIHRIFLDKNQNFALPTSRVIAALREGDLVFIGNPNNPTGNIFDREGLLAVVRAARAREATVVIDEAFLDFTGDSGLSLRQQVDDCRNLVVVSSLTKFFAIPGLRLGYAVAHPELINKMEALLPTWRINSLALTAARASIDDQIYLKQTVVTVRQEREFLQKRISLIPGLKVYPGAGNFILVDGEKSGVKARELQELLGPRGILIRSCDNFANLSPYFFRLAVRNHEENLQLLNVLGSVLS